MWGVVVTAMMVAVWSLAAGVWLWASGADMAVTLWLEGHYNQHANTLMRLLGEMGKGTFQASVCVAVGVFLAWRKLPGARAWLLCVPAFAMAGLVGLVVKFMVGRPRPKEVLWQGLNPFDVHPGLLDASYWSFPSGHAISTFAIATVLAMAFPRWRMIIGMLATVLAASRFLALTPHYLGDVVAGAGVGVAVALVVFQVARRKEWL